MSSAGVSIDRVLCDLAHPFRLRLEHVVDAGSRNGQVAVTAALRERQREGGVGVQIVVDGWCKVLRAWSRTSLM